MSKQAPKMDRTPQVIRWHIHDGTNLVCTHGHKLESPEQPHSHPDGGLGPAMVFLETEVQV